MLVEYASNNSGGYWWLKDEQWKALEAAGWKLFRGHGEFVYEDGRHKVGEDGLPVRSEARAERWLDAYANYAFKHFDNIKDALEEFERLTGMDVSDEGCNCCGPPHAFSWDAEGVAYGGHASGNALLQWLYPGKHIPRSMREALEG